MVHDYNYRRMFAHPGLIRDLLTDFVDGIRLDALRLHTLEWVNASHALETGEIRHGQQALHTPESLHGQTNLVARLFLLAGSRTREDMQGTFQSLCEQLADPVHSPLLRDFSRFAAWQLRRHLNDPSIPDITNALEVQRMLAESDLWWKKWQREGEIRGERKMLRIFLEQSLGPLPERAQRRLESASEGELERWAEQLRNGTMSLEQLIGS
jgi:hypothetical protein